MYSLIKKFLTLLGIFALSQPLWADETTTAYSAMPAVDCVVNPYRVVDIASPVAGVIEKLYVERSQQVAAGEVVARLEANVELANVELARYRAGIQSEIGLGKVNINFDQLRKKRVDSLLEEQNISLENADQIEREVQLSKWKLRQAKELADIRNLELRKAMEQLRQKSIMAPFDGFVLDTFKYRGEYVEDQAILRLAQLDPLVVEAIVPMENFGAIKAGMQAEILLEVLLKDKLKAEVMAVDRIGDTASSTFGVKLRMPNPENRIPAGLKCVVKFLEMVDEPAAPQTTDQAVETAPENLIVRIAEPDAQQVSTGTISSASLAESTVAEVEPEADTKPEMVDAPDQVAMVPLASPAKIPSSYMVLIKQPTNEDETQDFVDRLNAAGVSDFLVFSNGDNKGSISLGVFSTLANATNRQQDLDQLGFTTFTVERYE